MNNLQGRKNIVWAYMGNTRMYTALQNYSDRLDTVGVFAFKVNENGEIYESGVSISTMLPWRNVCCCGQKALQRGGFQGHMPQGAYLCAGGDR